MLAGHVADESEGFGHPIGYGHGLALAQLRGDELGKLTERGLRRVADIEDAAFVAGQLHQHGDVVGHEDAFAHLTSGDVQVETFLDAAGHVAQVSRGIDAGEQRRAQNREHHVVVSAPLRQKFLGHDLALGVWRRSVQRVRLVDEFAFVAAVDGDRADESQGLGSADLLESFAEIDRSLEIDVEEGLFLLGRARHHMRFAGGMEHHVEPAGQRGHTLRQVHGDIIRIEVAQRGDRTILSTQFGENVMPQEAGGSRKQ